MHSPSLYPQASQQQEQQAQQQQQQQHQSQAGQYYAAHPQLPRPAYSPPTLQHSQQQHQQHQHQHQQPQMGDIRPSPSEPQQYTIGQYTIGHSNTFPGTPSRPIETSVTSWPPYDGRTRDPFMQSTRAGSISGQLLNPLLANTTSPWQTQVSTASVPRTSYSASLDTYRDAWSMPTAGSQQQSPLQSHNAKFHSYGLPHSSQGSGSGHLPHLPYSQHGPGQRCLVGVEGYPPQRPRRGGRTRFSQEDDETLRFLKEKTQLSWKQIADFFPDRKSGTLQVRYCTKLKQKDQVPWTEDMNRRLRQVVREYEGDKWKEVARKLGPTFTPEACEERHREMVEYETLDHDDDAGSSSETKREQSQTMEVDSENPF